MNKILSFKNVSLIYHSPDHETLALDKINFEVAPGEFIAIVGPSGCGKTTILSLIAGILKPSSGEISINSNGSYTGYMFQKDHLFEWRNIKKNICLGLELQKKMTPENLDYVTNLANKYGIGDFMDRYPSQLSGGMKQRVALIRTLALQPEILLLDEPFSALDYQTKLKVCDDVSNIIRNEKKTAILVTHDIAEAISMSDRIIILSKRPANIVKIINIDLPKDITPFMRRQNKDFNKYFDIIWRELNNEKETKD